MKPRQALGGGGTDVAYKFTGKELDDSTGLYFYEARYYDAVLGRFISADTMVPDPLYPQELNRYSYTRNNPITLTDPTGHFTIPTHVSMTYTIAREQGFGFWQSLAYGLQAGWADVGTQSTNLYDTVGHMMSGVFPRTDELYAPPDITFQMALVRATFELSEGNVPFVVHAAEDTGPHSHVANNIPQEWHGFHFDQPTFDHMSADRHATDQELGVGGKRGRLVFELHREIEQERFVGEVREVIYERFLEKEVFGPGPPGFTPMGSQVVGRLLENPGWFEIGVDLLRNRPLINGQPIVGRAFDLWANTSLNYRAGNGFNGSSGTFGGYDPWADNGWDDF